jgi:tRNA pseudouridine55 synthase
MLLQPKEMDGILLVDKPRDHTSHDVVARLRGKLKMKRIGHAGTLDPMATGLLIMLIGKATRVSQYLVSLDKEYEGTIELGKVTDTQDADGEMMETRPVPASRYAAAAASLCRHNELQPLLAATR